jgi:hypothetical protein
VVNPLGSPQPITIELLGDSLGVDAADTAAVRTASPDWIWAGVLLGGLVLSLLTGGLFVRRRRPNAVPGADSSS